MNHHALNQLHLGDCIQIMQKLTAQSIDFMLTDPPYLVNYHSRDGRNIAGDRKGDWLIPAFQAAYDLLKENSFAISFYGWNRADLFLNAWRKAGFRIVGHFTFTKDYPSRTGFVEARHECAYLLAKGKPRPETKILPDVLPWGRYSGNRYHPTQKPLGLMRLLIRHYSQIGEVILDPFAGSASTLIAAAHLRRSWIGMEIDQIYHRKALARISHYQKRT